MTSKYEDKMTARAVVKYIATFIAGIVTGALWLATVIG